MKKKKVEVVEKVEAVEACPKADNSKKCKICDTVKAKIKITPEMKAKVTSFVKKNSKILTAVAVTFVTTAFLGKVASDKKVDRVRRRY